MQDKVAWTQQGPVSVFPIPRELVVPMTRMLAAASATARSWGALRLGH